MNTEEALEFIRNRRSIRSYKPDMVPDDVIEKIIEAGTYAATGMGRQSPIIIAVKDKFTRDRLSDLNAKIIGADIDPSTEHLSSSSYLRTAPHPHTSTMEASLWAT